MDADPLGRAPPHKYQRAKSDDSDIVLSPGRPSSSAAPAPPKASALLASPAKGRKPPSRIAVSTRRGPAPATESKVRGTLRTGNYNVPASPIASGSGAPSRLPMLKVSTPPDRRRAACDKNADLTAFCTTSGSSCSTVWTLRGRWLSCYGCLSRSDTRGGDENDARQGEAGSNAQEATILSVPTRFSRTARSDTSHD